MSTLLQDLHYGLRMLRKSPGATAVAVLSLALGIGANTTIFSFANGLFVRPLPVAEPDRLVTLFTSYRTESRNMHSSYPDYMDLRDRNTAFSGVAAHFYHPIGLKALGQPEVVMAQNVTWNYFDVLGVKPVLGRTFLPQEDETPDTHAVAILSHRAWQRHFASDAGIVGRTVLLNNHPFTVVGVAPRGFAGLCSVLAPEVFVPVMMSRRVSSFPVDFNARHHTMLKLVARLKPGVSLAQAQAATDALAANLAREYPNTNREKRFPMIEVNRNRVGLVETTDTMQKLIFIVLVVVGLVLLIACANVANLLLAQVAGRQPEVAVRLALGASRGRIVRQFLTEGLMLAALGCGLGLLLAAWGIDLLKALAPGVIEYRMELDVGLDRGVLAYTLLLGLASTAVFSLAPALQSLRMARLGSLKDHSLSVTPGRSKTRLQSGLVAAQLALSLVLLISTGLSLRSLGNTLAVHPGFETRNGFVLPLNLGYGQYDETRSRQFQREVVERVTALPGVHAAALTLDTPLGQLHVHNTVHVEGYQPRRNESMALRFTAVGPGYFETLGIPVLRGRPIDQSDTASSRPVAVVNEAMARRYWPGREPLGRVFRSGARTWEVVGMIKDGKYDSLRESPQPYFCVPLSQIDYYRRLDFHVRTEGDPRGVIPAVLREIRQLDSSLPVSNVMTHTQFLKNAVQETGGPAELVGPFSLLALALALVGVYGMMSHSVSRRTHELAVRMALGAGSGDVLRLVLRQGVRATLAGLALGLAGAFAATRVLAGFLYQVNTLDPAIFVGVSSALAAVAMLACLVPALRATRLQPGSALRFE